MVRPTNFSEATRCTGCLLNAEAGMDSGDMTHEDVAALFGQIKGFKQSEPNVTTPEDMADKVADFSAITTTRRAEKGSQL